jgi:uncharacterized protein YcbK (DUF882 family)
MGDLSEHFSTRELACHDCERCLVTGKLLAALEALRALGPEPIDVDDGYRCPEHNTDVGGVSGSQHTHGTAADIRIVGLSLQQMYDRAKSVPDFANGGIGVYPDGVPFIHVDVRLGRARWCRKGGVYLDIAASGLTL